MNTYFNLNYEFDISTIHKRIDEQLTQASSAYITVADGVVLNNANRNANYLKAVNESMFCICDSGYVPLYIKWIYGIRYPQYCGAQIFKDIVTSRKYNMCFLGTNTQILDALKANLIQYDSKIKDMLFYELPFKSVEEFDYEGIAKMVEEAKADIIWVALGAPKQDYFMNLLQKHLHHGVMLGVGAVFKFYSGLEEKRAPQWMLNHHLEFVFRIFSEPKKQLKRCGWIVATLPSLLWNEWKQKNNKRNE